MKNKSLENNSLIEKILSKNYIPLVITIILGFLIYGRTLFFDFTYLDDNNLILDHQYFLSNLANIFRSFLTDVFLLFNNSAFYYRPILTISLIFDYQIGNISPFIYHFTNIILHITSSYLIYVFLSKLNYEKTLAFLFSIIFLVHPVLTQAVAWIPGRNDSLLAIFALSTFIFFIKYLKNKKIKNLIFSLIFFALSIFTKESGIFILPIMFFFLYFIYKKENKEGKLSLFNFYFFFGSIGILGLWIILRNIALLGSTPATLSEMLKSIYLNLPAIIQFIGKIFLPFNLSVLPVIQNTTFLYGIISIIFLIIIFLFTKIKRWNFILLGAGWFFAFLLPSFIRPNSTLIADFIEHRLYLPIVGIFIILLETDLIRKINLKKKNTLIGISIFIFILSIMTIIHSGNFANRTVFWENATKTSPSFAFNYNNLGAMYYLDKNMDSAEKEFKKAIELNPREPMAHNNLGLVYANQNKFIEAEEEYKKEIENNPYYDSVYYNLGLLYYKQKKYTEAEYNWKKTLELNPNYFDAIKALIVYYYEQKNYKEMSIYARELQNRGFLLPDEFQKVIEP